MGSFLPVGRQPSKGGLLDPLVPAGPWLVPAPDAARCVWVVAVGRGEPEGGNSSRACGSHSAPIPVQTAWGGGRVPPVSLKSPCRARPRDGVFCTQSVDGLVSGNCLPAFVQKEGLP